MREFKFRVWDLDDKEMRNESMSNIYRNEHSIHGDIYITRQQPLGDYHRVEVMQYTGLKDKNGVEIYEGDVIGLDFGEGYIPAIVKFSGWYWYAEYIQFKDIEYFDEFCDENKMYADCITFGNIYENPELLESSDKHE